MNSIKTLEEMKEIRQQLKDQNKKVVFTNGCFDLIHAGHVDYLSKAKALGDVMDQFKKKPSVVLSFHF